jgi:hypothetical protein
MKKYIKTLAAIVNSAGIFRGRDNKINKWKHACMCACAKINILKNTVDELKTEIKGWQSLHGRLGGDDYFNKYQTPDDLYDMINCLSNRERACAAYKVAEQLGTETPDLAYEQDWEKVEQQVRLDARKLKERAYVLQRRAEQSEEKNETLIEKINMLEAQLAEYVEIVKNLAKQSIKQSIEKDAPLFVPMEFTYSTSAPCKFCGNGPGDYDGWCSSCVELSDL